MPRPAPPRAPPAPAVVHRLPVALGDDAALVRALSEGRPAAASAAWDRFAPLVRRLLRRSLGPAVDVEDSVQEVFLRFFQRIGTLRDPGALRSFVIGITLHVAGSELRRRRVRRFLRLTDDGVLPEPPAQSNGREARAALGRLYAILDTLDDEGRLVFVLRHIEEMELTEVAAALNTSLATIKRRLAKVTARVLAMIEREPELREYVRALPAEGGA